MSMCFAQTMATPHESPPFGPAIPWVVTAFLPPLILFSFRLRPFQSSPRTIVSCPKTMSAFELCTLSIKGLAPERFAVSKTVQPPGGRASSDAVSWGGPGFSASPILLALIAESRLRSAERRRTCLCLAPPTTLAFHIQAVLSLFPVPLLGSAMLMSIHILHRLIVHGFVGGALS